MPISYDFFAQLHNFLCHQQAAYVSLQTSSCCTHETNYLHARNDDDVDKLMHHNFRLASQECIAPLVATSRQSD